MKDADPRIVDPANRLPRAVRRSVIDDDDLDLDVALLQHRTDREEEQVLSIVRRDHNRNIWRHRTKSRSFSPSPQVRALVGGFAVDTWDARRMASGGIHVLSGFTVGAMARSRVSAFVGGVLSHGVLDAVPHRDYPSWTANAIETAAGVALAVVFAKGLSRERRDRAFFGALGAITPDIETVAYKAGWLPADRKLFPTHSGAIVHGRGGPASTVLLSAASVAVAIFAVRTVRLESGIPASQPRRAGR
jgi:hypothetical protein